VSLLAPLTEPFAFGFMKTGLLAAVIVSVVCAVMGTYVVLKAPPRREGADRSIQVQPLE